MSCISVKNVSKIIKGKTLLDNISFELEQGKIYGFTGSNGSGKSILFRIIAGLVVPSKGEVLVSNKNIYKPYRTFPSNMGVMIDSVGLFPYLNAVDNLQYLAAIKNVITIEEIKNAIIRVGLDPDNKIPYNKYSLGMKQRLLIAQAIMEKPDILIFDEPTNSLDENGVDLFREIVKQENKRGCTILISSHITEDINKLCNEVFHISNGVLEGGAKP